MRALFALPAYIRNRIAQYSHPDIKIFFIGFNKCATTSIHDWMIASGIRSVHWQTRKKENIALGIEAAIANDRLVEFCSRYTAFSDMFYVSSSKIIEYNRSFREFHLSFPKSYFVFNDRNVEKWVKSRSNHRGGDLLKRYCAFYKADNDVILNMWRQNHSEHAREVLEYFSGNPRFLHYKIDEDPPEALSDFLAPTFVIDPKILSKKNVTKTSRVERPQSA